MPVNSHLRWAEITDFTPGLYEAGGTFLMPQNAAQTMLDCEAVPGGGLRAFFKGGATVPTTGITNAATSVIIAMGVSDSPGSGGAGTYGPDRYAMLFEPSTKVTRVYRLNQAQETPDTSWELLKATTAADLAVARAGSFAPFVDSTGTQYMLFVIRTGSSDSGLWYCQRSGATMAGSQGTSFDFSGVGQSTTFTIHINGVAYPVVLDANYTSQALTAAAIQSQIDAPITYVEVTSPAGILTFTPVSSSVRLSLTNYVRNGTPDTYLSNGQGSDVQKISTKTGPLAVNQGRIIIGAGLSSRIYYGATGDISDVDTNYIDPGPYEDLSDASVIIPMEPSDLLIGKQGAPWLLLQGDISSATTPIREMGSGHTTIADGTEACKTPEGVAFIEKDGMIYLTDGRTFNPLSQQLGGFPTPNGASDLRLISSGTMAYMNNYLFCPWGYVWNRLTKSWFTFTPPSGGTTAPSFHVPMRQTQAVWAGETTAAAGGIAWADYTVWDTQSGSNTRHRTRKGAYTWRSPVYTPGEGNHIAIREVQIYYHSFRAGSTIAVTRTDSGGHAVTRTFTTSAIDADPTGGVDLVTDGTGRGIARLLFPSIGADYQDIKIVASADTTSYEAPMIEKIRIGTSVAIANASTTEGVT